jgi:hypothetical protein
VNNPGVDGVPTSLTDDPTICNDMPGGNEPLASVTDDKTVFAVAIKLCGDVRIYPSPELRTTGVPAVTSGETIKDVDTTPILTLNAIANCAGTVDANEWVITITPS